MNYQQKLKRRYVEYIQISLNNALLSVNKKDIEIYSNEFQDLIIDRNKQYWSFDCKIKKSKNLRRQRKTKRTLIHRQKKWDERKEEESKRED